MYTDFLQTGTSTRIQPCEAGATPTTVEYAIFTCPHCSKPFEMPSASIKKLKSSRCLKHLQDCPEYKGSVPPASEKKKDPTNAELLEQMEKQAAQHAKQLEDAETRAEARAQARHQEMLARIGRAHGLPPPDPTSEDDLNRRLLDKQKDECKRARREERKRKRSEDASLRAAQSLRLDDVQKKRLRAALHPDGKDESQSAALKHFRDLFGL